MRKILTSQIEEIVYSLALKAGVRITPSCLAAMERAERAESNPSAKFALGTLLENSRIAAEKKMPVCQDTGMAIVLLKLGMGVHLEGKPLAEAVNCGVRRAYADGYFRKSVCDPITRKNTGDNTPAVLHTEIVGGDGLEITFLPKGFGSENMSRIYMLKPAQGVEGIIDAIVETVKIAGSRPCPPVVVGVGIGGTFDTSAHLAKVALTRDLSSHNQREDIKNIEITALERINALNIGCQGFKGDTTALAVLCEYAPTHIAGLPVAVNIQCHCARCERAEI